VTQTGEKWLYDIHFSIEEIDSYFFPDEKNFLDYRLNKKTSQALGGFTFLYRPIVL